MRRRIEIDWVSLNKRRTWDKTPVIRGVQEQYRGPWWPTLVGASLWAIAAYGLWLLFKDVTP